MPPIPSDPTLRKLTSPQVKIVQSGPACFLHVLDSCIFRSTFIQWTWLPFPTKQVAQISSVPVLYCNSYWIEFSCKWSLLLALKAAIRRGLQLTDWTILIFFLRLSLPLQNLALFWHTVRLSCVHFSKLKSGSPCTHAHQVLMEPFHMPGRSMWTVMVVLKWPTRCLGCVCCFHLRFGRMVCETMCWVRLEANSDFGI